ncbi:hypothetical protein [Clostridium sp.]|uniref:hypothetical protein n=1 Tax=Clostridium sp. TaxID=1506 RepID=UPI0025C3DBE3|nr:hypothetical protein [Clostridium sp.]
MAYTKNGMNMYVGRYRVVCEFCRETLKPCKEDNYIYCKNGGQIYRFDDETLVYYKEGRNKANLTVNSLKSQGIEIINNNSTDEDLMFKFYEKDIHKIADIFGARTLGANIKSASKRNLKLFEWFNENKQYYLEKGLIKEISEERKEQARKSLEKFRERISE